ncbi:type II toxin-antitoxin system HicA family toxin [Desulfobacula toluolica]|uniref:YcfA family protein n=1 Tax=Desulfobacula toluolica (strain DSM 7467 / Tol2) TaxID=651182 RepID=K0NGN6_DESTT|nr:type II toxin-antitoxin system HicA family toxin [Desulfobacula toluolica]CCK79008.1 YcfA family protein [Desulfobacula toluolica Tol2]
MTQSPSLQGKQLIKVLKAIKFSVIRIKGSHHFLRHVDGRSTFIPVHSGETIGPGLLTKSLRDCELSRDDLLKLM